MPPKKVSKKSSNGATVGYEAELWQMADALKGSMDAARYIEAGRGLGCDGGCDGGVGGGRGRYGQHG